MIKPIRTVDQAADSIRRRILEGEFLPGVRLPAERRLSEELGISRLTLRAALARLESEGLVRPRQGDGVVVLDYRQEAGAELLPHLLVHGHVELLEPFLALRRVLAGEAAAGAALKATDAELDELDARARELQGLHGEALVDGNLAFSRQVVELSGNTPMLLLFNTVARVYKSRAEVVQAMHQHESGVKASFVAIVQLLRARDPGLARTTVVDVLEALDAETIRHQEAP